jgi:DNA-binding response OmpR family regulator
MGASVLLVDDDPTIAMLVRLCLTAGGHRVTAVTNGRDALRTFHLSQPDLVILDIGLPELDGLKVLERVREFSDVPVLMLTGQSDAAQRVRALRAGADDHMGKPFDGEELGARVDALLRRSRSAEEPAVYVDEHLVVDLIQHRVLVDGAEVPLSATEFSLLAAFVRHPGQVLSVEQLLDQAWADGSSWGTERVKFSVMRLRRKLGWPSDGGPLETVRGVGYRYCPPH